MCVMAGRGRNEKESRRAAANVLRVRRDERERWINDGQTPSGDGPLLRERAVRTTLLIGNEAKPFAECGDDLRCFLVGELLNQFTRDRFKAGHDRG